MFEKYEQLLRNTHRKVYEGTLKIRNEAKNLSLEDSVDELFLMRESWLLADDLRKELVNLMHRMYALICAQWVQKHLNDTTQLDLIRGKLASATPHIGKMVRFPEKNSDAWKEMMLKFGIPEHLTTMFEPQWTNMKEHINQLLADGKNLPPALAQFSTFTIPTVKLHPRKGAKDSLREATDGTEDE